MKGGQSEVGYIVRMRTACWAEVWKDMLGSWEGSKTKSWMPSVTTL